MSKRATQIEVEFYDGSGGGAKSHRHLPVDRAPFQKKQTLTLHSLEKHDKLYSSMVRKSFGDGKYLSPGNEGHLGLKSLGRDEVNPFQAHLDDFDSFREAELEQIDEDEPPFMKLDMSSS
mmetsp:Transcript_33749/g.24779  ORF Transcript_33749/g.24779 Transcript_33749/m.24779 type:complete len:120 (-) Transcript_33749:772-1131(-)